MNHRVFLALMVALNLVFLSQAPATGEDDFVMDYFWTEIRNTPSSHPKVALVFGGGGARGLAHIGVLKVLEREKIPIDIITGASVGAMVGALYSSGVSIDQLEKMADEIGWNQITDVSRAALVKLVLTESLLSTERMENYLGRYMGNKRFSDLKIPFACVAADIQTGEKIIFHEGEVAPAVRASATIPGIFKAMKYRHRYLVDGGLVDNVPVDIAKMLGADIIIAVASTGDFRSYPTSNVLAVLNQSLYIIGYGMAEKSLKQADLIISPDVGDVNALQLWRGRECIEGGMIAAEKKVDEIKRLIVNRSFKTLVSSAKERKVIP